MQMTTKRWLLLFAAITVGVAVIIALVGTALEAKADVRVRSDFGVMKGGDCITYPNGNHRWGTVEVRKTTNDIPHVHVWTFTWSMDWCESNTHLWRVHWNKPTGNTNPLLLWGYDPGGLTMLKDDHTGDDQYRRYQGHFHYDVAGFDRNCWPELEFKLHAGEAEDLRKLEGC